MADKNTEINQDIDLTKTEIDSSNIFDDFDTDIDLIEEVDKIKRDRNRDVFFYLSKSAHFLQIIFWLGLVALIVSFSYIYVQNNKDISNSNILDPFCSVILGDIDNDETYCSSISYLKSKYESQLSALKTDQATKILRILEKLYEVENFTKSKDVLFLTDKSNSKLPVLSIIEEFDNIKNKFDKVDKQKVQCSGVVIDSKKEILSMNCIAYSAGYEKGLRGFDGTTESPLKGSSLSIANSFINFIDQKSDIFTIIDRQKVFRAETTLGQKTDFTNMTSFKLKLKYNLK